MASDATDEVLCVPVVDDDELEELDPAESTMVTDAKGLSLAKSKIPPVSDTMADTSLKLRKPRARAGTEIGPPTDMPDHDRSTGEDDDHDFDDPAPDGTSTFAGFEGDAFDEDSDVRESPLSRTETVPGHDVHAPPFEMPVAWEPTPLPAPAPPAPPVMPPPPVASSAPRISASDLPSPGRELIELKRERNAKEREVLELRQAVHEKEMLLLAWQDREADVESRTVDLEERLDRSEREKQFLANERAVVELRLSELEQHSSRAIQDLKRQIGAQTVREAELEGTIQRVNTELRTMSAEVETLNAQLSDREAALVTAERHMSDLADRISRQQAEMQRLNAEIGAVAAQAATAREQMEETQAEVQSLRDHKAELERDLAVERDEKAGARRALEEAKVHIQQARERIRAEERQRAKAMRALEIFLGILRETGYDVSSRKDD